MITNSSNNNSVEGERNKPVINDVKKPQINIYDNQQPDISQFVNDNEKNQNNDQQKTEKRKRCFKCKKKLLKIYDTKCKCDNEYCFNCLPSFSHNCTFDFVKHNKNILREQNQVIVAEKVAKI